MPSIPSLEEMLKAGVHFGHQTSRWHPKMNQYIFGGRGGVHVIDLERTQKELENTLEAVKGIAARGGTIMFVGTKRQAQPIIEEQAKACGMPYVTNRWLGGTLTNFDQIKKSIKRFKELKEQREKGELRKYTKKEQLLIDREIEDMDEKIGGIQDLVTTPDAVFVADLRFDKTAVLEARTVGVKVIGLADTNVNPLRADHVIPANDDAVRSIEMMTRLVSEAINEGKDASQKAAAAKAPATKAPAA